MFAAVCAATELLFPAIIISIIVFVRVTVVDECPISAQRPTLLSLAYNVVHLAGGITYLCPAAVPYFIGQGNFRK